MPETVGRIRRAQGLIIGMADNRAISWGIAKAARAQGAGFDTAALRR
jgi:enoyl-[acyl-carrier protein] reductase I